MTIEQVSSSENSDNKMELVTDNRCEDFIPQEMVDDDIYILDVPLEEICLGDQVRQQYSEESIYELAESIRTQGLLQPIQLKREGDVFRIVYGHRRYLAAKRLGLPTIKGIIDYVSDVDILSKQIVENIQREDLHPIDVAQGFRQLMKLKNINQKELASYVGKSRPYISQSLSILNLLEKVQHAKLLREINDWSILTLLSRISDENLFQKALEEVKNGCNRGELRSFLNAYTDKKERKEAEKGKKSRQKNIESFSRRAVKKLESFRSEIMKLVKRYENELEDDELNGLGNRFQSHLDELRELLSGLFKIRKKVESSSASTDDEAAESLVFPGTAATASLSYKLVSISFSFISFSYSYSYSSSHKNRKKEIIRFILEKLPNLDRKVLEEATVEEIIDYWNSLPFKKIEKSVEGFFYQSLARRYSLPEHYLELKAESLRNSATTNCDPGSDNTQKKNDT